MSLSTTKKAIIGVAVAAVLIAGGLIYHQSTSKKVNASSQNDSNYVLKLADESGTCEAPLEIAISKGFFKAEGLKYQLVKLTQDTTALDATAAGKVDAGNSLLAQTIPPIANGAQIKITTGLHTGCISLLVAKGSAIKSAADLKGKTIGVANVAGSEAGFVKSYLTHAGLNVNGNTPDVTLTSYDESELPLVLSKEQVSAIAIEDPNTQIAVKQYGFGILASSATTAPFNTEYCCVAYVSASLAKNHPNIARKYTLALQKAAAWVNTHEAETVEIQSKDNYAAGAISTNLMAMKTYTWKASFTGAETAFKQVAEDLQKTGGLSKTIDINQLEKNTLLKFDGVK